MTDMNIICDVQGTEEWFACRIGCLTSSRIADAIRKAKRESTGELQCRQDLKLELAVERVTGKPMAHFVSMWMERGAELEPLARAAYELRNDVEVKQTGFVLHPTLKWAGCSPDGLVGDEGLVELKVPKSTTHAEYLLGERVPAEYEPQMLWQMAVTERSWCDFVSYCPDFPSPLDLFVCRLPRDTERILAMESQAHTFLQEVEALQYRLKGGLASALEQSISAKV